MAMIPGQAHGFSQTPVKVSAHCNVRISDATVLALKEIRERERDGIATSLKYVDKQLAIASDAGTKAAVKSLKFGNQLHQPQVVTLIHRHQTDETVRFDNRLWNELVIK